MSEAAPQATHLVGRRAPDFEVACTATPAHPSHVARLQDYRDRWLIFMFYPQDFTLVCPTEISAMSDRFEEFAELNADILGISTDSIETHEKWIATGRSLGGLGQIKFPLGSDPGGETCRTYNVFAEAQHVALRGLFIIDPNSVVQYQLVQNLSTGRRTSEILRALKALQMGGMCSENWMAGQPTLDPAVELKPGNMISHFHIEETLGEGGFATVYRAMDRVLERNVALKILKQVDDRVPSIQDEARAAAALNHPNVCAVYGIEESEGVPMIVMEYLVGHPLSKRIEEGSTPIEDAANMGSQIAAGMGAAHDAGVVHGDLKPGNIMLTDEGRIKILDFGLAGRRPVVDSGGTTTLAENGKPEMIAGTPRYLSPEQAEGQPATAASDIFSFGLILYELLTGRRAFGGPNLLAILNRIKSIDPDTFANDVDDPFGTLLRQMLVRDPAERTITMSKIEDQIKA